MMRKQLRTAMMAVLGMSAMFGTAWGQAQTSTLPAAKPAAAASYDRALLTPAALIAKAPETYDVKFTTTKGDFVVRVTRAWAPRGADRFYNLVKHGYYDQASFFRVISGFMAQFGISAYPQVSRVWNASPIKDDPVKESNKKGMITYAMAGPNTRTTQVFINYGDNAQLDGMGFSPFGQVVEGMAVVESLYSEYGDGPPEGKGPDQGKVQALGKAYLDKSFPKLDSIKTARIVTPAAPPAKPADKPI